MVAKFHATRLLCIRIIESMKKFKSLAVFAAVVILGTALTAFSCDGKADLSENASRFIAAVEALPDVGSLSLLDANDVENAEGLYATLSKADKDEPDVIAAHNTLTPLVSRINALKESAEDDLSEEAKAFVAAVKVLPTEVAVTEADEGKVNAAEALYASLTPADIEADIVKSALQKVNALKDKIEELKNNKSPGGENGALADMTCRQIIERLYADVNTAALNSQKQYCVFSDTEDVKTRCAWFLGVEGIPIAEASAHEPAISPATYSFVVVRITDGENYAQWKTAIDDKLEVNKWICVSAKAKRVERSGNVIMAVLAENANADALATAFLAFK